MTPEARNPADSPSGELPGPLPGATATGASHDTSGRDDHADLRQIVVHPAVWPRLEAWLASRGIALCPVPIDGDDLPTYVMQPSDDLMRTAPAR